MNFIKVAWRDISGIFKNRFIRASVTAIIVVPLLYTLLYLAAFWDPYSRLDKLPVAVVNLDKGGTKDGAPVNAGKELVENMKKGKQLDWNFKSQADAEDGLKGKKYYAEFIIPENFTQEMLSAKDGKPKQPKIIFHTNMKKNFLASQIINSGNKDLRAQLAKNMTDLYTKATFDNLYALKDGMKQAADGSKQLKDGIGTLNGSVPELKNGANQLNDGAIALNSGLGKLNGQIPTLASGISTAYKGSGDLVNGYKKVQPGASMLASGLQSSSDKVPELANGATSLKDGTKLVSNGVNELISSSAKSQAAIKAAVEAYQKNPGVATLTNLFTVLKAVQDESSSPASVAKITALQQGAQKTAIGAEQLSGGVNQLSQGLKSAAVASKQLSDGVNQLSDGTTKLNAGLAQINGAVPTLAGGVGQLYDGSSKLKVGVGTLVGKLPMLEDGASKLAAGSTQLNTKLTDGSNQLNKSLVNDSNSMGKFVSDGVEINEDPINEVDNYGTGFAPYFISLSLYVGAILMFFVITDKVDPDIKASNFSLVIGKFFSYGYVGVAQGILAAVVVLFLGLKPNNLPLYFLFVIFMSYVFIAIVQLLIFLLGQVGRMLAIVFLILQLTAAGGTFPNELVPSFFKTINPFMPFTYSVEGLREIISGTDYAVLTKDFLILLAIMVGCLTISVLFKDRADKAQARIEEMKNSMNV